MPQRSAPDIAGGSGCQRQTKGVFKKTGVIGVRRCVVKALKPLLERGIKGVVTGLEYTLVLWFNYTLTLNRIYNNSVTTPALRATSPQGEALEQHLRQTIKTKRCEAS